MVRRENFIETLRNSLPNHRPQNIQDLWNERNRFDHYLADFLFDWTTEEEIENLLNNEQELTRMTFDNYIHLASLGMNREQDPLPSDKIVFVSPCIGCSSPCDAGFSLNNNNRVLVKTDDNPILHKVILQMTVLLQLMTHPKSDLLVTILTKEFPSNYVNSQQREFFTGNCLENKIPMGFLGNLVGVFDNCGCYPKLCDITAGLMSLLMAKRPAASFDILSEHFFVPILVKYLKRVLSLVQINQCIVEQYVGVVTFLNILPVCHMIAGWPAATRLNGFKDIVQLVTHIVMIICFQITSPDGNSQYDSSLDVTKFPEVYNARIFIESLQQGTWRQDILSQHPHSYAVIAGIEVLGEYSRQGVNLNINIPVAFGFPINFADAILDYKSGIEELVERIEQYAYIEPIMNAIINHERAPMPDIESSLLYGPLLDARKRCGLHSCRKDQHNTGRNLLQCTGGCGGLEYYCCEDHQRAHWDFHKNFCRSNNR